MRPAEGGAFHTRRMEGVDFGGKIHRVKKKSDVRVMPATPTCSLYLQTRRVSFSHRGSGCASIGSPRTKRRRSCASASAVSYRSLGSFRKHFNMMVSNVVDVQDRPPEAVLHQLGSVPREPEDPGVESRDARKHELEGRRSTRRFCAPWGPLEMRSLRTDVPRRLQRLQWPRASLQL